MSIRNHGGLILAGCQVPTKAALSLPLLIWTAERKYNERLIGRGKGRERSRSNYHHRQNRLDSRKLNLLLIKAD